ncbi:hypothetical protein [Mucilaginibacter sp.]|uniref:hypothetical protein n=1 Tax=Mucilaginibacter sp. TaxID=1882438 RepID=UPI0032663DC6
MEFKSANPDKVYSKITYNGTHSLVNVQDVSGETIKQVMELCDNNHLNTNAGFKCRRVYYLRGGRNQAPYEQVLVGFWKPIFCLPNYLRLCIACHFGIRKRRKCLPSTMKKAKPCDNSFCVVSPLIAGRLLNRIVICL